MAARASARTSPKGESKQGLVVTLVFFVLATIGLGVSAYFGFSEQEDLRKKAEDSDNKQKAEAKLIDFYKFQSMLYWAFISNTNGVKAEDLEGFDALKSKFDEGSILPKDKYEKEKEEATLVKTRIDFLEKLNFKDAAEKELTLKYDKASKKPLNTLDEVVVAQQKRYESLKTRFEKTEAELKEIQESEKKVKDEFADFKTKMMKSLADQTGETKKDFSQFAMQRDALRKEKDDLKKLLDTEKTDRAKDKEELEEKIVAIEKKLKNKDLEAQNLSNQLALTKTQGNEVAKNIRSDFRIVSIDRFGSQPYINIGSADMVKTQDTFSIHAIGPDGRPRPEVKGTVEVINVVGEHLSQCRVLTVKDTGRDPIMKGDVVFNPTWNPQARKRIAVLGIIDLTGDGKDQIYEFIRQMERQGVIIDAFLDPSTFEVRNTPGITPKTDFLIEGDGLDAATAPRGMTTEKIEALNKAIKEMRTSAKENGVISVDLRKYLEMSGFRVPKNYFQMGPSSNAQFSRGSALNKPAGDAVPKDEPKDEKKEEAPKKDN